MKLYYRKQKLGLFFLVPTFAVYRDALEGSLFVIGFLWWAFGFRAEGGKKYDGPCRCEEGVKQCKKDNPDIAHVCQSCGDLIYPAGIAELCRDCAQDYVNG